MKFKYTILLISFLYSYSYSQNYNYNCLKEFLIIKTNNMIDINNRKLMIYYMNYSDINTCNRDKFQSFSSHLKNGDSSNSIINIVIVGKICNKDSQFIDIVKQFIRSDYFFLDFNDEIRNCIGLKANITTLLFDKNFVLIGRDDYNMFNYTKSPKYYNNFLIPFNSTLLSKESNYIIKPTQIFIDNNLLFITDNFSYSYIVYKLDAEFSIIRNNRLFTIETQFYKSAINSETNNKEFNWFLNFQKQFLINLPNYYSGIIKYKGDFVHHLLLADTLKKFENKGVSFLLHDYLYNDSNKEMIKFENEYIPENYGLLYNNHYLYLRSNHGTKLFITDENFNIIIKESLSTKTDFIDRSLISSDKKYNGFILNFYLKIFNKTKYKNKKLTKIKIEPQGILKLIFNYKKFKAPTEYSDINFYPEINYQPQSMNFFEGKLIVFIKGIENDGFIQIYNTNSLKLLEEQQINFFKQNNPLKEIYFAGVYNYQLFFLCKYSDNNWYLNSVDINNIFKK